jgi:hypothetical protein
MSLYSQMRIRKNQIANALAKGQQLTTDQKKYYDAKGSDWKRAIAKQVEEVKAYYERQRQGGRFIVGGAYRQNQYYEQQAKLGNVYYITPDGKITSDKTKGTPWTTEELQNPDNQEFLSSAISSIREQEKYQKELDKRNFSFAGGYDADSKMSLEGSYVSLKAPALKPINQSMIQSQQLNQIQSQSRLQAEIKRQRGDRVFNLGTDLRKAEQIQPKPSIFNRVFSYPARLMELPARQEYKRNPVYNEDGKPLTYNELSRLPKEELKKYGFTRTSVVEIGLIADTGLGAGGLKAVKSAKFLTPFRAEKNLALDLFRGTKAFVKNPTQTIQTLRGANKYKPLEYEIFRAKQVKNALTTLKFKPSTASNIANKLYTTRTGAWGRVVTKNAVEIGILDTGNKLNDYLSLRELPKEQREGGKYAGFQGELPKLSKEYNIKGEQFGLSSDYSVKAPSLKGSARGVYFFGNSLGLGRDREAFIKSSEQYFLSLGYSRNKALEYANREWKASRRGDVLYDAYLTRGSSIQEYGGRYLIGRNFKDYGKKGIKAVGKEEIAKQLSKATRSLWGLGSVEGLSQGYAYSSTQGMQYTGKNALFDLSIGAVSSRVLGRSIAVNSVLRPKVSRYTNYFANVLDPSEPAGDFLENFRGWQNKALRNVERPNPRLNKIITANEIVGFDVGIKKKTQGTKQKTNNNLLSINYNQRTTPRTKIRTNIPSLQPPSFNFVKSPINPKIEPRPQTTVIDTTPETFPIEPLIPIPISTNTQTETIIPTIIPVVTPQFRIPPPIPLNLGGSNGLGYGGGKKNQKYINELDIGLGLITGGNTKGMGDFAFNLKAPTTKSIKKRTNEIKKQQKALNNLSRTSVKRFNPFSVLR